MYAEVAAYTRAGDFRDFIVGNVTLGQKASLLWAVNAGRLCQTAGLFLLGFYIGRKGLFATSGRNARIWVKVLIISAISFAPLLALSELDMSGDTVVCDIISGQSLQAHRRQPALLWADEPDKLHHAVHHRCRHLFPLRSLPCPALRLHGQPADRTVHFRAPTHLLQMVAQQAQAGATGVCLASLDLAREGEIKPLTHRARSHGGCTAGHRHYHPQHRHGHDEEKSLMRRHYHTPFTHAVTTAVHCRRGNPTPARPRLGRQRPLPGA